VLAKRLHAPYPGLPQVTARAALEVCAAPRGRAAEVLERGYLARLRPVEGGAAAGAGDAPPPWHDRQRRPPCDRRGHAIEEESDLLDITADPRIRDLKAPADR
jgi:CPA1 family monovalent cation:H+ antiporter